MDYEALAKQYGGVVTQPPVDYEALAKQYGGVVAPPSGIPGPRQPPGLLARFGRGAASLADVTIGGVIPAVVQQVGYPLARIGRTPEEAQAATQAMVRAVDQPFGKAFGVANTPEYQAEAGRQIVDFIGQNVQKGAKWISERTGVPVSDVENIIGTTAIAVPKVVAPVAREVKAVTAPVIQDIKAGVTAPFQPQLQARRERLSLEDYARGPQIEAAKDAKRLKLALNPVDIKSSPSTRAMAMAAGEEGLRNIAATNIPRVQQVGRNEMGLPPIAQLNGPAAFDSARAKVAGPYEEVKKLPVQQADQFVVAGLEGLRPNQALIGKQSEAAAANTLIDDALAKTQGGLSGSQLLDNISSLRKDAQKIHKSPSATPAQIDLANTQLAIATQLESMLDSSISNPRLLGQWREARQKMARIYGYEAATDFNTGLIDINKLAGITAKDNALTGDIAALGRVAGNYPSAFTTTVEAPSFRERMITRGGPTGTAGGLTAAMLGADWQTGLAAGTGAAVLGYLGGKYAANRLASPSYQAGLNVRDMRIPVPQPPLGPTIPQNRMLAPYQPEVVGPGGAGEASRLRVVSYDENGVPIYMANEPQPGFTMPPQPGFGAVPTPFAQRGLPNEIPRQTYEAQKRAELAQGFREAAERKPAGQGTPLVFDAAGNLVPETTVGQANIVGAPTALSSAVQKLSGQVIEQPSTSYRTMTIAPKTGAQPYTRIIKKEGETTFERGVSRAFDLTAEERIAWNKAKADLAEVVPGMKALSDEAVAARMADRNWTDKAVANAREKAEALARRDALLTEQLANRNNLRLLARDIEAKQKELAKIKEDRARMMDLADMLDESMRAPRPNVSGKQQGPKTRAAKRNALAPDNQNNLAP